MLNNQAMLATQVSNSWKRHLILPLLGVLTGLTTLCSVSHAQGVGGGGRGVGKTVLLTSFGTWGKMRENSSGPVAEKTKALLQAEGYTVKICELPVLWDRAAELAVDCYQQMAAKPDLVVSFGVGRSDHIATGAVNLDSGPKDAGQVKRKKHVIDPSLPERIDFRLPGAWTFDQAIRSSGSTLGLKPNAGSFICNNLAFHLGHYFEREAIPFFFVHVNNHTDKNLIKQLRFVSAEAMLDNTAVQAARVIDIVFH